MHIVGGFLGVPDEVNLGSAGCQIIIETAFGLVARGSDNAIDGNNLLVLLAVHDYRAFGGHLLQEPAGFDLDLMLLEQVNKHDPVLMRDRFS